MNLFKYKWLVKSSKSKYFHNTNQNVDLYSIRYKLIFLKESGYDVDKYIEYVDLELHKQFMRNIKIYKSDLIRKGHLPVYCLVDCDCKCYECERGE